MYTKESVSKMKKKVLFINNHFQYSDGTVRALIGLVNNLDQNKYDITIKPLFKCDKKLAKELKPGIKLKKVFGFYFRGFNRLVKKIPISFLYKKVVGEEYDIEIAFQCDLPTLIVGASKNSRAVHVFWMHGYSLWPKEYAKADKVVCVSKYCEEKAREEMHGNVNITHCYNLIDDRKIITLSQMAVPKEWDFSDRVKPVFVTVGRLSPEKGYMRLIKIAQNLFTEGFLFTLVIIGGGPEEKILQKYIRENNLQDKVFLTGSTTNPHCITSKADCFICSSFAEGYSTVCAEAAILGIPVITTAVPGGAEIIETCSCGLLTDIDDNSLKAGIRSVLENQSILSDWKQTLQTTKYRFGLQSRVKELHVLFDELYELSLKK